MPSGGLHELIDAHYEALYRYAYRLSGSAADAAPDGAVSVPRHAFATAPAGGLFGDTVCCVGPVPGNGSVRLKLADGAPPGFVTVMVSSESLPAATVPGENALLPAATGITVSVPALRSRLLTMSADGVVAVTVPIGRSLLCPPVLTLPAA